MSPKRALRNLALIFTMVVGLPPFAAAQDATSLPDAPRLKPGRKWVRAGANFAKSESADALIALTRRAKQAGYNGMVVGDFKFDKFQLATPEILANLTRFRQVAREAGMDVFVSVAPFGYADGLLSNDPNLAEGMRVLDAAFVVKDGRLVPLDDTTRLVNGGLETWGKSGPEGWTVDDPGVVSFRDEAVKHGGTASLRQEEIAAGDKHGHGRLYQAIAVKPWHNYHVSVWIKTENCTSKDWRIFAYDGKMPLDWQSPDVKPTQDWAQYHVTFDSLEHTQLDLYIGCWDGRKGKVWFDDVRIEPAGFVDVLRRDSLPLKVTSPDGRTAYAEEKDFAAVADPKLDCDPILGHFSNWHEPPAVAIPAGSRLKEGDKVLASYHFACSCGKANCINMCMSEPKTYEIVENQIRWVKKHAQPDGYFLGHDEIRMQGWDDTCAKTGKTSGQILADNIRRCVAIVKRVDPNKPVVVWNDMFDPYHNAREKDDNGQPGHVYMTRGGNWGGSWEGLTPDLGIVTWKYDSEPSLRFFSSRGEQQVLAGFYDTDPARIVPWLETASKFPGLAGVMYTTWANDYSKLDVFMEQVRAFEARTAK